MVISKIKEPANALSHMIGAVLSVLGLVFLLYKAAGPRRPAAGCGFRHIWSEPDFALLGKYGLSCPAGIRTLDADFA